MGYDGQGEWHEEWTLSADGNFELTGGNSQVRGGAGAGRRGGSRGRGGEERERKEGEEEGRGRFFPHRLSCRGTDGVKATESSRTERLGGKNGLK
eukprot:159743-Hanusia_phi.AAC.1